MAGAGRGHPGEGAELANEVRLIVKRLACRIDPPHPGVEAEAQAFAAKLKRSIEERSAATPTASAVPMSTRPRKPSIEPPSSSPN